MPSKIRLVAFPRIFGAIEELQDADLLRVGAADQHAHGRGLAERSGLRQQLQIARALGVAVGVGVKAPFRCHSGAAQLGHQGFVAQALAVGFELFGLGQGLAQLAPVPAFHQRHIAQAFLAPHQHGQQAARGGARGDFVAARTHLAALA